MLNITLTGNVLDENESYINCYYDVYYKRQNILISGLRTELNQYNFNVGDSNHLTQNGDFKENDIILIRFNTNIDTLSNSEKFCSIAVVYANESLIVKDVQLKTVQLPTCDFNLDNALVDETINIIPNKSLDNSWLYKANVMYQRRTLYGYNIFPNLLSNDNNISYNFSGEWVGVNTFTYSTFGLKTILYKIILPNSEILECSKQIKITKKEPIITYTVPSTLNINQNVNINILVTDNNSTINNIKHFFDSSLIKETTNLNYSYDVLLNSNKIYNYRTEVLWNDGFDDKLLIKNGNFQIQNQKPEISPVIEYINNTKNNLKIIPNAVDPENDIDFARYKIYIRKETIFENTNDIDYTWVLLDTLESNILDLGVFIDFYKTGNFKIEVQAFDKGSLGSDISELFVDIECKTGTKDQCSGYFDWSKTTSMLKFTMDEQKLQFKIEENTLQFTMNEQKLQFNINEEQIKFTMNEEQISFSLNCSKL